MAHSNPIGLNLLYTEVSKVTHADGKSDLLQWYPLSMAYCSNSECEAQISTLRWRTQPYHAPLFDKSLLYLHVEEEVKTNFKLKSKYWKLIDPTWPVCDEFIPYYLHENPWFNKDVWGGPYFLFCKLCTAVLRGNQTNRISFKKQTKRMSFKKD